MTLKAGGQRGFTLVEIMVVIVILGIVVSVASPLYMANIRNAKETQCRSNRQAVIRAAIAYYGTIEEPSGAAIPAIEELVNLGYFDTEPKCPCGGVYVWANNSYSEDELPHLGCSKHYIPTTPQLIMVNTLNSELSTLNSELFLFPCPLYPVSDEIPCRVKSNTDGVEGFAPCGLSPSYLCEYFHGPWPCAGRNQEAQRYLGSSGTGRPQFRKRSLFSSENTAQHGIRESRGHGIAVLCPAGIGKGGQGSVPLPPETVEVQR